MKKFTRQSLSEHNGKGGRPIYIAHQGRVFDVSQSRLWKTGVHMGRHRAGSDLTSEIHAAPHGLEVLERFPQVGTLEEDLHDGDKGLPRALGLAINKFPVLRRHPHPMVVHFPIVFSISAAAFLLLHLITGLKALETTSFHCVAGSAVFCPIAGLTGWLTWWTNYQRRPMKAVRIKLIGTLLLLGLSTAALLLRVLQPELMAKLNTTSVIYVVLVMTMAPIVGLVGWYGASLTFPVER